MAVKTECKTECVCVCDCWIAVGAGNWQTGLHTETTRWSSQHTPASSFRTHAGFGQFRQVDRPLTTGCRSEFLRTVVYEMLYDTLLYIFLQCFDTVGWVTGRASSL